MILSLKRCKFIWKLLENIQFFVEVLAHLKIEEQKRVIILVSTLQILVYKVLK